MFNFTKYTKWYFAIIEKAKERKYNKKDYFETHRIIPKVIGGNDDKSNLVKLYAREHFICHLLLTKMNNHNGLKYALVMMTVENQHHERYKCPSKIYEYIKKCNSIATSNRLTGHKGHNSGRKLYHSIYTDKQKYFKINDIIPNEFILGSSNKRKSSMMGKNSGKIYYHHMESGKVIALNKGAPIPNGYVKGNPNANTTKYTKNKGSIWVFNEITGERKRVNEMPEGFVKSGGKKWIHNPITKECILISKNNVLPEGFILGRLMNWKRNEPKK